MADVTIVGVRVIGCAIAYFLSREGLKVAVVEQDSLGSHASGFAIGGLNPMRFAPELIDLMLPLAWKSFQMHNGLYEALKEETGIDYYFRQSPRIALALTEAEVEQLESLVDSQ